MDYLLLIIIILAIVTAIGFILSRPFTSTTELQGIYKPQDDRKDQYQVLLQEIKVIERDFKDGTIDQESCLAQTDEKKHLAANLLRLINQPLEAEITLDHAADVVEITSNQPMAEPPPPGSYFCSQCGDLVLTSDKFCTHCGHRLQP